MLLEVIYNYDCDCDYDCDYDYGLMNTDVVLANKKWRC